MIRLSDASRRDLIVASAMLAAPSLLIAKPAFAQRAECTAAGVSDRFTEAARMCVDESRRDNARTARPPQSVSVQLPATAPAAPIAVATINGGTAATVSGAPISITMPGYRQRLYVAKREVRARGGARAPHALVTAIAHRYRINPRLLASVMHTESRGRYGAVSNKGALGLMQVMPATARQMGVRNPREMLTNPVLALSTGAVYLKHLQSQFGNDVPLVVAAYNAGPGAVRKAGRRIPRYRETQDYVRKVVGGYAGRTR